MTLREPAYSKQSMTATARPTRHKLEFQNRTKLRRNL